MKRAVLSIAMTTLLLGATAQSSKGFDENADVWPGYLDYAYVYSSAEPEALAERLAEYGREAGIPLAEYVREQYEAAASNRQAPFDEVRTRRKAIAYLLLYLAEGEPMYIEASAEAAREFSNTLGRHENRYWVHYIQAQRAAEKGQRFDFIAELLELWLQVVVPLETPYETLHTLSLTETANSGFVSALPYLYENVARMILIRSQQLGIDRDLDPLAAIVRLLHDGRVGGQPDVIPVAASSRVYLDRIIDRLNGPESDAGSLTFTLALFEASKLHEQARALLATEGLGKQTLEAIRVATGAYAAALDRADTLQGQCAVYTRVLRQMGEIYAAKQRLGVDPEIDTPFSIEAAIGVYSELASNLDAGWEEHGYRTTGRQSYLRAMHGLWEEIQEVSLTAADSYLAKSLANAQRADEHSRNAARIYTRYLAMFSKFATSETLEAVPDSAYFAAYEAARGYADAVLRSGRSNPTADELELSTRRTVAALRFFPFDPTTWPALTHALQRQGRESDYLGLVRPVADSVTRSRHLATWISKREAGADSLDAMRAALSDSLAVMHLGFAEADGMAQLELGLAELRAERAAVAARLSALAETRPAADRLPDPMAVPASLDLGTEGMDRAALKRRRAELVALQGELDRKLEAQARAIPLYRAAVESTDLAAQLRVRRDHSLHRLLRRMYHENRS